MCARWFDHVERMENENWIGKSRRLDFSGATGKGRPPEACNQVVQGNLQALHLEKRLA